MRSGIVFDIKEFAVHDGPGVRQTIFLKGCPLRCMWCHNPEGLDTRPQLMKNSASCTGCESCGKVCARGSSPCTACGECVRVCPMGLLQISGREMTSGQLLEIIRKDADYYASLDGGVTFSGGEPLMQWEYLVEILERLRDIHTAVETSGYAQPDAFRLAAENTSYLMVDVKLMDSAKHKRYTGRDNRLILENLSWLCGREIPFTVRIPLIPGVNDGEDNLRETARFLSGARALRGVELLPYHKTAGAKYKMLGWEYQPEFDVDAPVRPNLDVFAGYNIRSCVL